MTHIQFCSYIYHHQGRDAINFPLLSTIFLHLLIWYICQAIFVALNKRVGHLCINLVSFLEISQLLGNFSSSRFLEFFQLFGIFPAFWIFFQLFLKKIKLLKKLQLLEFFPAFWIFSQLFGIFYSFLEFFTAFFQLFAFFPAIWNFFHFSEFFQLFGKFSTFWKIFNFSENFQLFGNI